MSQPKRVQNPKLNLIGLAQELDTGLWDWEDDEKKALVAQDAERIAEVIHQRLVAAGYVPTDLYGIIHDKDSSMKWSEQHQRLVKMPTREHIHVVVRFKKGQGDTLEKLAEVMGLEPQYVEKAGRGRFAFDNMLSYFVHAKDDDKHQYDPDEVATILGREYRAIYEESKDRWWVGRAKKQRERASETFDGLFEKCLSGEVLKEDLLTNEEYRRIYAQNRSKIDDALESYGMARAYKAARALANGDFKTTVYFITGVSGVGKTRLARQLIAHIMQQAKDSGAHWQMYAAASRNPLDDWNGEEILFMDDLRASAMSASDWLKLLDPHTPAAASARYHNKENVAPRAVVLTASIDVDRFFLELRQGNDVNEALTQFIRRLTYRVEVLKTDETDEGRVYEVGKVAEIEPYVFLGEWVHYGVDEVVRFGTTQAVSQALSGGLSENNRDVELPGVEWEKLPKQQKPIIGAASPIMSASTRMAPIDEWGNIVMTSQLRRALENIS